MQRYRSQLLLISPIAQGALAGLLWALVALVVPADVRTHVPDQGFISSVVLLGHVISLVPRFGGLLLADWFGALGWEVSDSGLVLLVLLIGLALGAFLGALRRLRTE